MPADIYGYLHVCAYVCICMCVRTRVCMQDKLSVVGDAVRSELQSLGAGLRRRKEVGTARGLLELLQELAHVASKVGTCS